MCGIAGKYNLNGAPVAPELIQAMNSTLAHRGPDDEGVLAEGNVGLGHRRLSIIDLSPRGHQPMASHDKKVWLTYNGEIYNYQLLRKELAALGHPFRGDSDTEVLLRLYEAYGTDCLHHLRGMFAFAVWDARKQQLFLARDRIGKKPLYYYFDGRSLIFASEIKAIMADPSVQPEINYEALCDYFRYLYVPDPKTIYKNIFKLQPGHFLTCSQGGLQETEYWDISFGQAAAAEEQQLSGELLSLLEESVRLRMVSDVPLGAFLSGGIDSSAVVALMARQNGKQVTTCSIGFDSDAHDEVRFAGQVARTFKTDHHELTVKHDVDAMLLDLVRHFDEPFADSSAVPTFHVSRMARSRVKVALAGDGGDENFAGYEKYHLDAVENRLRKRVPRTVRQHLFPQFASVLTNTGSQMLRRGSTLFRALQAEPDYGFYLSNSAMTDDLWQQLSNADSRRRSGGYDPFSVTQKYYHKADTDDHLARVLYTDLKTYLPGDILVKVDRMSMANSLEVRAPLLDHNVVQFAANLPSNLKYHQGSKKYILKQALAGVLPNEILHRRKMGFSVPLAEWLRNGLRERAASSFLAGDSSLHDFFDPPVIRQLWEEHQSCARDHSTLLWSLLMFDLWHKTFMDKKLPEAAHAA